MASWTLPLVVVCLTPQSFLAECAVQCCSRAPALRFRDSPELQQLCRARSLCGDTHQRKDLSLSIHVRRKWEKQLWRRHLLDRASCGDWSARRFLQRKSGSSASRVAAGLVRQFGSRDAAVAHVKDHFEQKFDFPVAAPISFSDLPNSEPDFTEEEVCRTVLKMRTGKTTGMSKVSVELLRCLVALPLGLHALTLMLNSFLRDPTTANVELASGWVILLPKTLWVCHAKNFRPIV